MRELMNRYEIVIGLEVHVELATRTKVFCSCPTDFGAPPNTQCCPVCMGLPGAMPTLNRRAVEYAVMAGLALDCQIAGLSKTDRKNYFYPDLPKAYQISQYDLPLCRDGHLEIETEKGPRRIGITRIHLEEDAGKLIHEEARGTMIDCNRCGVPLIEIVSEPELRSAEEAKDYVRRLRSVLLYTGVSDCRMNEGSLRCDVNLSVRKKGETTLGVRTEMKNLNSFAFIGKAIEYEAARQIRILEAGEAVLRETRRFDPDTGETYSMRRKEDARDYRFFPEPDLPPILLSDREIEAIRRSIPALPAQRQKLYTERYGLSRNDAVTLTARRSMADYFEAAAPLTEHPKLLANMLLTELTRLSEAEDFFCPIAPAHMAALATLAGEAVINSSTAKTLIGQMWKEDRDPRSLVEEQGLAQINDRALLSELARRVMEENPKSVADYRAGKKAAAKALVGRVMAATGGKANPILTARLVEALLSE